MTYTRHGRHIPGTQLEDRPIGLLTENCGGLEECKACEDDTTAALMPDVLKIVEEANRPEASKKVYYSKQTVDELYAFLALPEVLKVEHIYRIVDDMQESGFVTRINERSVRADIPPTVAQSYLNNPKAVIAVFDALKRSGLSGPQIVQTLNDIDNQGVIFRMEKD